MNALLDYTALSAIASDEVEGARLLSPFTQVLLPSVLAFVIRRDSWADGNEPLSDAQWDTVDALISTAFEELFMPIDLFPLAPVLLQDFKAQNTAGGTATAGAWEKRTLNTLTDLAGLGVTLSNSEFTVPAGRWLFRWSAPASTCGLHQTRLYSVTEGTPAGYGTSEISAASDASYARSVGNLIQTNAAETTYRLEHRVQTTRATDGYGRAANFANELYSQMELTRLAD